MSAPVNLVQPHSDKGRSRDYDDDDDDDDDHVCSCRKKAHCQDISYYPTLHKMAAYYIYTWLTAIWNEVKGYIEINLIELFFAFSNGFLS